VDACPKLTPSQINRSLEHRRYRLMMRNRIWSRIDYVPHEGQRLKHDAIARGARFISERCGRRGGKSEGWSTELTTELGFGPIGHLPFRLCLVAAPESDITDNIFSLVWRWVVDQKVLGYAPLNSSVRMRYIEMPWHSKIEGKTTKEPKSLRGPGLVMTVADEFAFGDDVLYDYLMPPLIDCAGILGCPTTPNGANHAHETHEDWTEQAPYDPRTVSESARAAMIEMGIKHIDAAEHHKGDKEYFTVHWTSYDNPFLPEGEIAKLEAYYRRTGNFDVFAEEYLGIVGALAGSIYPMFDKKRHVREFDLDLSLGPITLGVDWGFTNPTAIGFWQFIGNDRVLLHDEIYQSGLVTEEVADLVLAWCAEHGVDPMNDDQFNLAYCDPSGPKDIQVFENKGIPSASQTGSGEKLNELKPGIVTTRSMFAREGEPPAILIHARCVNHIREIPKYQVKRTAKREADPDEKPKKIDDHACDAMRYAIYGELGDVFDPERLFL